MRKGMAKHTYTELEVIQHLQYIYNKYNQPISNHLLKEAGGMPTQKVYTRLFGSIQNACKKAHVPYQRKPCNKPKSKKQNRKGEEKISEDGYVMKIIDYQSAKNITVEFQDKFKYQFKTTYRNWNRGKYKNPYHSNIFGCCCKGNATTKINRKKKKSYMVWYAMVQRCYDNKTQENKPTYVKCEVCQDWKCFEKFEIWFNENFYSINEEEMCLDKDILKKGNKIYSPEFCVFVPQRINKLFTKRHLHRGPYPIGVDKEGNYFKADCSDGYGKKIYLGSYSSAHEAFVHYKKYKEQLIKDIADEYKLFIPNVLYQAMYNYTVEETD